ncbi:U-box domain-containing protein 56 [Lacrimispora sp.]|uniref:U-box domain-containing protein 56 n=1 Tax=Lacrimispora sp. TaxID=2719234 RepID=UPI002897F83B|nr:U-box domain-containing protein 56 [Lacrimispora sp.]
MLDQDIYEALEKELERNHIREDVDEVLLDLAEALADRGIMDKELVLTESYGKTQIQVTGICSEEEGEVNILMKQVRIGKKEFEINDYFL